MTATRSSSAPGAIRFADHTTLRVGGSAAAWVVARDEDAVVAEVTRADAAGEIVWVVGGGSNLLVSDDGVGGRVVEVATAGIEPSVSDDAVTVQVAAGEAWDDLVHLAVDEGWAGIEAMSGIPGRVGATPVQNVGAYGQEVSGVLRDLHALDRRTGEVVTLTREQCGFGYRRSALKADPSRWVVLSVTLRLQRAQAGTVRYAELARTLGVDLHGSAAIAAIRDAVLHLRRAKGMVLDEADCDTWSAGSFFTNPVVPEVVASTISEECPRYPSDAGTKLSAAWLIERAGVHRGFSLTTPPRAGVSSKHTLALTNRGTASASDLLDLARHIRRRVDEAFGIRLEPEVRLLGCAL